MIDAERIAAEGEAIAARAHWLLVPEDLHAAGWVCGRALASWMADLPVLARLAGEDRLVRFALWTSGGAPMGALEGAEIPLKLLAQAGVRQVRTVGVARPAPAISGLSGLTSILERS